MNVELRVQALMWEYERAMELMERGVVSGVVAYRYMGRLEQAMQLLQHGKGHGTLKRWNGRFRALWHRGVRAVLRELPGNTELAEQTEEMRWLQTATRTYAVEHLEAAVASSQVPTEDAAAVSWSTSVGGGVMMRAHGDLGHQGRRPHRGHQAQGLYLRAGADPERLRGRPALPRPCPAHARERPAHADGSGGLRMKTAPLR
ncbi:MAG: hypothetical protein ACLSDQ_13070 [Adlercreutzia equolifaciens]